jgi:type IV pilus assembly protein PilQ
MNQLTHKHGLYLVIFSLVALMAGFAGCASNKTADVKKADDKRITGITTRISDDQVIVIIDGNQPLTYTAIKQVFPMGVLFHFPDTALDRVTSVTTPPPNSIIGSVKATELVEDKSTTSRIFIAMKTDAPYDLKPQDSALQISFPKAAGSAAAAPAPITEKPLAQKPAPAPVKSIKNLPSAKRLKTVTATALKNNVVVNVNADGVIRNYKSFTLNSKQPRIVIDMPGLKSPFKGEQRQAVKSPYLKQVRHFGHSDKVRLVLDVPKSSLAKFSAAPSASGLLIQIGDVSAAKQSPKAAKPVVAKQKPPVKPATTTGAAAPGSGKTAWVNRIDFSSKENGKSALIIGTTVPVKYDLQKAGPKRLHLKLLDASLPDYRKRALITTRFESAVDRVTPVQTAAMKGDSLFTIELREAVPYTVAQQGKTLQVNFAASSIPPKPYEDANLPEWKQVLAKAPVPSAGKAEKGGMTAAVKPAAAKQPLTAGRARTAEERLQALLPEKKFTGEKIAFDFYDMDIRNVFRLIKEVSGKSFAVDKNVTGKVSLRFDKPVPWDQVLDLLLKMNQLGMTMEGNIIRIATLSTLAQEEKLKQAQLKAAQQAQEQAKALEPLFTEYIPISYSNASTEVLPHIQAIVTEGRGKADVDTRNNQVIITDTAVKIKQAKEIAQKIDTVTPQVVIEARIVEANTNFTREIGFDWGEVTLGQFDVPYTNRWKAGPTVFTANNIPDTLAIENAASLAFSLFKTSGTPFSIVDATLAASEVEGKTNIISSPKIVTLDNKKAKIKQGFEVPYTERDSSGRETIKFKNVDLLLEVTPTVTPDNRITMTIFVTKNDVVDPTEAEPALSINEAETEILIDDGDTIVIGGILKSTLSWGESGIPGLRRMGVLGWLFKYQQEIDDKNELLIFLTPRIVQLEQKRLS